MQEILDYFSTVMDPVKLSLYENINRILKLFHFQDHEHELTDLLNSAGVGDMGIIHDGVNDILHVALDKITKQHDMLVSGTLDDKVKVTEALYNLTNWGERDFIYDMSNAQEPPNFIISNMLSHVSNLDNFFFLVHIESVSHALVNRVRELYQPMDTDIGEINLKRLEIVKTYVGRHSDTWAENLLVNLGVQLELDISSIFKITNEYINTLTLLTEEQAAIQILGLYLISDEPLNNLSVTIKDSLDILFPNPEHMSFMNKVFSYIQELLMKEGLNG